MPLFLDACALAKRYLQEGKSTTTRRIITGRSRHWGGLFVSSFVEIEVVSAIAKGAREHPNPLLRKDALARVPQSVGIFRRDYTSGGLQVLRATAEIERAAIDELTRRPQHSIGAGDAIHLVTALDLNTRSTYPLVFVTADRGLAAAAKEHGLTVFDPNYQSEHDLQRLMGG